MFAVVSWGRAWGGGWGIPGLFIFTIYREWKSTCPPGLYLSIQEERNTHAPTRKLPQESFQVFWEIFKFSPRIPDNRKGGKLKKLWKCGNARSASPDPLPTPAGPHRDTPGPTSPPQSHPTLYNTFIISHPGPSHFCHADPSYLRHPPPHRAHVGGVALTPQSDI